jgi:hypothetical protein
MPNRRLLVAANGAKMLGYDLRLKPRVRGAASYNVQPARY